MTLHMKTSAQDEWYIKRCINLARRAGKLGDFPYGALLVLKNKVVSEKYNESFTKNEVYRHAELLALTNAQKKLNRDQLSACTLYSSVEPCPMCSFAIQELNIKRVVFGLKSPIMGGYSRWSILQDQKLNQTFPNSFGRAPEIVAGVLKDAVIEGWKQWNNDKWERLYNKGVFR